MERFHIASTYKVLLRIIGGGMTVCDTSNHSECYQSSIAVIDHELHICSTLSFLVKNVSKVFASEDKFHSCLKSRLTNSIPCCKNEIRSHNPLGRRSQRFLRASVH